MAQAFAELGHRVVAVTPTDDPTVRSAAPEDLLGFHPAFTIRPLSRRVHRGQSYLHALRIGRLATPGQVDLVYSRSLRACLVPAARGVPTVFEAHTMTSFDSRQDRWVLGRLLRSPGMRGIVAISAGLAADLTAELGIPADRILVAHDGVRPTGAGPETRDIGSGEPLTVGYTGSLYAGRGVDVLLAVAARAPWLHLHLVGGPEPAAAELATELAGRGLTDRVTVHGIVTPARARELQRQFDVLVAPFANRVLTDSGVDSTRWMSPMKIFEYMASGRPMITSDLPVLREVLRPDIDALMVPPEDPDALLAALERLRDDSGLRERLARSALARATAEFTWEQRAQRILDRFLPAPQKDER
jgi:glycosyltransferase involved in cell wall biosynthesis